MADDRVVMMSVEGYKTLAAPDKGKGLHWCTDVHTELPIKVRSHGSGSERPMTIPKLFLNCVKENGARNSMLVERNGKVIVWTW
jgi:long-chain-fatty-acid--CoA ligase ACSBG